jgi:hypothetical protein
MPLTSPVAAFTVATSVLPEDQFADLLDAVGGSTTAVNASKPPAWTVEDPVMLTPVTATKELLTCIMAEAEQ